MFEPDEFEWDEAKSRANADKHGLGFEFSLRVFLDPQFVTLDTSRSFDGEVRFKAVGRAYGRLFTAVFTWRELRRRIISFRRANPKEERSYVYRSDEA